MKYALTPLQFDIFTKLIQSHYSLMQQELEEQNMQMMMQDQIMMEQGPGGEKGGKGGVNKGSTPNTTSHNQTAAPSGASLGRELGG